MKLSSNNTFTTIAAFCVAIFFSEVVDVSSSTVAGVNVVCATPLTEEITIQEALSFGVCWLDTTIADSVYDTSSSDGDASVASASSTTTTATATATATNTTSEEECKNPNTNQVRRKWAKKPTHERLDDVLRGMIQTTSNKGGKQQQITLPHEQQLVVEQQEICDVSNNNFISDVVHRARRIMLKQQQQRYSPNSRI